MTHQNLINGQYKKLPPPNRLDKLVTFCYDRFDLHSGSLDLYQPDSKDYKLTQRRALRWKRNAERYARLRDWMAK
jgi:hypothetical protein